MTKESNFDCDFFELTMGAAPKFMLGKSTLPTGIGGPIVLWIIYLLTFVAAPIVLGSLRGEPADITLLSLSAWGAFYIMFASLIARSASKRVIADLVRIWPYIKHENWVSEANASIQRKFRSYLPDTIALVSALLGLLLTVAALHSDKGLLQYNLATTRLMPDALTGQLDTITQNNANPHFWEWCFFGANFFSLYFLSARTTFVASFMLEFTSRIHAEAITKSYDPVDAPQARYLVDIARSILLFWAGISLAVATLPLLYSSLGNFIQIVVTVSMYFSLFVGTWVFIRTEQQIRRLVRDARILKLGDIGYKLSLLEEKEVLDDADANRFEMLKAHYSHLSTTGYSTSYLITLASLSLPFVGTIVSVIIEWSNAQ